jgi:ATP-GRASP peptide maturase of grasp-with-spasm system
MILILSKNSIEVTTEMVMDWLYYLGYNSIRLNGDTIMNAKQINLDITNNIDGFIFNNYKNFNLSDISVVWFRRWSDRDFLTKYVNTDKIEFPFQYLEMINQDYNCIRNYFFWKLKIKPFISNPSSTFLLNKFIILNIAQEIGIKIPATIVCNNKTDLLVFLNKYQKIITKDIEYSPFTTIGDKSYQTYTTEINELNLKKVPEYFANSAFQELIEKKYEIRSFFFFNRIYSMAIFSQKDSQTQIDFRAYNYNKPNRNVPYVLPKNIEEKIKILMKKLNLDTGSIDLIKTKDNEYLFLEVNPVGQFGMVSTPCNYNLEYIVAKKLITYEKKSNKRQSI